MTFSSYTGNFLGGVDCYLPDYFKALGPCNLFRLEPKDDSGLTISELFTYDGK